MIIDFKYVDEETDLSTLRLVDWDLVVRKIPWNVYRIPDHVHSISNGPLGINDLWCCPATENPSSENLIRFNGTPGGVVWGTVIQEQQDIRMKNDYSLEKRVVGYITRNGIKFYRILGRDIEYVNAMLSHALMKIQEHPINFYSRNWRKELLGRRIYWKDEPGIIKNIVEREGCLIIEADGIDRFRPPAYSLEIEDESSSLEYIKTDFLDERIWWFRETFEEKTFRKEKQNKLTRQIKTEIEEERKLMEKNRMDVPINLITKNPPRNRNKGVNIEDLDYPKSGSPEGELL